MGRNTPIRFDPRTGYPVQHNILSSTVIAKDCMTADALATAFMVMGLEEAEAFCKADTTIDAYLFIVEKMESSRLSTRKE